MCLCTVWKEVGEEKKVVMQDVAGVEADGDGYVLVDLFGTRKFVRGRIKELDFVSEHKMIIDNSL